MHGLMGAEFECSARFYLVRLSADRLVHGQCYNNILLSLLVEFLADCLGAFSFSSF